MKRLSIICGIAVLLLLMAVPAFPVSYEFDFDDDGVWDTARSLTQGETVEVKIWLDDYSEETLFGARLYFQYDPSKILVNEAHSYPNDDAHGGPFEHRFSIIRKEENGVYKLELAHFDSVSVSNNKILFFTIELECIVDGADVAIKAANDLGFGTYSNGYVVYFVKDERGGDEAVYVYPDDAVVDYDDDGDEVGDFFSDNCRVTPNGPDGGTCICGGELCMSDDDCEYGTCSMDQEDTNSDGVGDVCDEFLCQSYLCRYECCMVKRDAGREVDDNVCVGYVDSTSCENANCYWNPQGLPAPGVCTVDVCIADTDFNGRISGGGDTRALKMELGRMDCPCGPYSEDLCQKYFEKYTCCVDLSNAGSNVDIDDCLSYANQTDCNNAGCYWNTQGLPAPGVCTVDVCIADTDFSGRITGGDLTALKEELSRQDCPCNP